MLWCQSFHHKPQLCLVPWYPNTPVLTMCYDPTGCWLLCACSQCLLILVPTATILDPQAHVDAIWNTGDTTEIKLEKQTGGSFCETLSSSNRNQLPVYTVLAIPMICTQYLCQFVHCLSGIASCVCWWQSLEGEHIAVLGTKVSNLTIGRKVVKRIECGSVAPRIFSACIE